MPESEKTEVADRVAESRARLGERIDELGRRVDAVRERAASVRRVAGRPIVKAVVAGIAGFWAGSVLGRIVRPGPARPRVVAPPGIGRSMIREALVVAAGAMTRSWINRRLAPT
jgi:hypothetical protein